MHRKSAFVDVHENEDGGSGCSEYECEISYPPVPPINGSQSEQFSSSQALSYWYWMNAYTKYIEEGTSGV